MFEFKTDPRILYDLARERLQTQLAFFDVLDAKVGTMFAASSGILALLAAVFAIRAEELGRETVVITSIAGFAYLIVVLALAATHWPQTYDIGPELDAIWHDAQLKDDSILVPELILDYISYYRHNDRWRWLKLSAARAALIATFVEVLVLAVGLAVAV